MELTMTNSFGFCELNEQETMAVDGGSIVIFPINYPAVRIGMYLGQMIAYNVKVSEINGYNETVTSNNRPDLVKPYPPKPTF